MLKTYGTLADPPIRVDDRLQVAEIPLELEIVHDERIGLVWRAKHLMI